MPWYESWVYMFAAVGGVLVRARWFSAQEKWGRETWQDVFFAAILGLLWGHQFTIDIPAIGKMPWPLLRLAPEAPLLARAAGMALASTLLIGGIKKLLLTKAPALFELLTGTKLNGNGAATAPKPPAPAPPPPATPPA